jgi:heme/copper-type cytochrome/quinol oxidase subunit 4
MKGRVIYLFFLIATLIVITVLFFTKIYYAAVALVFSWLIISHREIWSLIRHRKLPPIDERISENISKSLRNSFIFFILLIIFTILIYSTLPSTLLKPALESYLAVLLACIGIIYALSYLYFDRIEANLSNMSEKVLRYCMIIGIASLLIVFTNVFYPSAIYPNSETWLIFHQLTLIGSAIIFAFSLIISLIIILKALFSRSQYISG